MSDEWSSEEEEESIDFSAEFAAALQLEADDAKKKEQQQQPAVAEANNEKSPYQTMRDIWNAQRRVEAAAAAESATPAPGYLSSNQDNTFDDLPDDLSAPCSSSGSGNRDNNNASMYAIKHQSDSITSRNETDDSKKKQQQQQKAVAVASNEKSPYQTMKDIIKQRRVPAAEVATPAPKFPSSNQDSTFDNLPDDLSAPSSSSSGNHTNNDDSPPSMIATLSAIKQQTISTIKQQSNMMIKGFHIRRDGTRVPHNYGSQAERLYCEASELLEHKRYAQARTKLDEYLSLKSGGCDHCTHDDKFILQVEVGYLNVELTKKNIKNAADLWVTAATNFDDDDGGYCSDSGYGPCSEIVNYAFEIVDGFKELRNIPREYIDDLNGATVTQITDLLEFIIESFVMPSAERGGAIFQEDDDFLLPIQSGVRELIARGEKKTATEFFGRVSSVGHGIYASFMKETLTEYFDDLQPQFVNVTIDLLEYIVEYFVVTKDKVDFRLQIQSGILHLIEHGEAKKAKGIYDSIISSGYVKYVAFMKEGEYNWSEDGAMSAFLQTRGHSKPQEEWMV